MKSIIVRTKYLCFLWKSSLANFSGNFNISDNISLINSSHPIFILSIILISS